MSRTELKFQLKKRRIDKGIVSLRAKTDVGEATRHTTKYVTTRNAPPSDGFSVGEDV
eukprot:TRINITY_DN16241_c0_g1_i1.p2 TRINITY_DN16241_c0_g1~~TRINITY_DN16241_c0_g1_i1.p2  ORF type:complete len:57 (+),score=8.94 TRINITY_DN16241_c0_g1_i1:227-397(+)